MTAASFSGTVSRINIEILIRDKGIITAELARHLAPLTCSALLKGLPVEDRIHRFADKFYYIETRLTIGAEKQRTAFKRGDLAYMTSNASVCFFLREGVTPPLNPIGYVTSNIELLESTTPGDVVSITRPPR